MYLAFSEMAARSEIFPARWRKPFLIWMDGIEAGWAIPLLLIGFVAVWMAFLVVAYLGGDLHPDVSETWTLGRSIEWGYAKASPLDGMGRARMDLGVSADQLAVSVAGADHFGDRAVGRRSDHAPLRKGR